MSELSSDARSFIDASRRAHDPPSGARARVRARVDARLQAPAAPRLRTLPRWLTLVGAVALVALVAWFARRPVAPPPAPVITPAPTARSVAAPAPLVAPSPVVAPTPVVAPAPVALPAARPRPQPPTDTFPEELRLVTAAQRALAGGQLDAADGALREHTRRFPRGVLAEERDATRALVTCSRGDRDASAREAARFLGAHPRSPQAPRVRRACGVE